MKHNALVLHIDHSLRVRIAEVGVMWRAEVYLGLIQWVCNLVRKDTRGETADDFAHAVVVRGVKYIVVDEDVVAQEVELNKPFAR